MSGATPVPSITALLRRAEAALAAPDGGALPPLAQDLAAFILAHRAPGADAGEARRLAHAIALASLGRRHLWQDLGLDGREQVSSLIRHYFEPLFLRNTGNLKWKRFLYLELGLTQGNDDLRPPGCGACEEFGRCYRAAQNA
jgi:nitrogen fixation protein NifQ